MSKTLQIIIEKAHKTGFANKNGRQRLIEGILKPLNQLAMKKLISCL